MSMVEEEEQQAAAAENESKAKVEKDHTLPAPIMLDASQVSGIEAKRAALRLLHPLKMYVTSPKHGLDTIRLIPPALRNSIDSLLARHQFTSGQNDQLHRRDYPLWHVANRTAIEYAVMARIMDELIKRVPSIDTHAVTDYGAATNAACIALIETLNKYGLLSSDAAELERRDRDETSQHVDLHTPVAPLARPFRIYRPVERNSGLAKHGQELLNGGGWVERQGLEVRYRATLRTMQGGEVIKDGKNGATTPITLPSDIEPSGIVTAPFSMSLLPKDQRFRTLESLWALTARGGALILVENGTIEGFNVVRECREHLLSKYGTRNPEFRDHADAAHVIAPCAGGGVCPMGDPALKRSCWHRTQILTTSLPLRMPGKPARSRDGFTIETFSYIILHKGRIHVSESDAQRALIKWQAKERDVLEPGQQKVHRWLQEGQDALRKQEEEQGEQAYADEMQAQDDLDAAQQATESWSDTADPSHTDNPTAPLTMSARTAKKTDLSPFSSLLPHTAPPQSMFERMDYPRILRKPLRRGEHVILDLCNEETKLERRVIGKSFGMPYTLARSLTEGDLWPVAKRTRDPSQTPSIGEKRRAEVAERKAKRRAQWAEMEKEDAEKAKQAFKEAQKAAKEAKLAERKKRIKEKHNAEIVARGGKPRPDEPEKKPKLAPGPVKPATQEQLDLLFPPGVEDEMEQQFAKMVTRDNDADLYPEEKEKKTKKKKQKATNKQATNNAENNSQSATANDDATWTDADADANASTSPAAAPSSSSTTADVPEGDFDSASSFADSSFTSSSSSLDADSGVGMPSWMHEVMRHAKPSRGGLEYEGPTMPEMDQDDVDEDDDGEYQFPMDPTIRAAKLAKFKDEVTAAKALKGKISENDADDESSSHHHPVRETRRAKAAAKREAEKEARKRSPLATPRPERQTLNEQKPTRQQPNDRSSPSKHASSSVPTDTSSTPPQPSFTDDPTASPTSFSSQSSSPSSSSIRLPRWARYRTIKNPDPIPATPENTRQWSEQALAKSRTALGTNPTPRADIHGNNKKESAAAHRSASAPPAAKSSASSSSSTTSSSSSSLPAHLRHLANDVSPAMVAKLGALSAAARARRDAIEQSLLNKAEQKPKSKGKGKAKVA